VLVTQPEIDSHQKALDMLFKLGSEAGAAQPALIFEADRIMDQLAKGKTEDDLLNGFTYLAVYKSTLKLIASHGDDRNALACLTKHAGFGLKDGKSQLPAEIERQLFGGDLFSSQPGAVVALGRLGQRAPAIREQVVDALLDLVASNSTIRQEHAIRVLPLSGLAAARALPKIKDLKYAPAEGLQSAVKRATAEIEGRIKADKAAGDGRDMKALIPLLEDKFDSPAHRHALDLIFQKHPDLYSIVYQLFRDEVVPGHYREVAKELKSFEKAKPDPRLAAILTAHKTYLSTRPAKLVQRNDSFEASIEVNMGDNKEKSDRIELLELHESILAAAGGPNDNGTSQIVDACRTIIEEALKKAREAPGFGSDAEKQLRAKVQTLQKSLHEKTDKAGREKVLGILLSKGQKLVLALSDVSAIGLDAERYQLDFLLKVIEYWASQDKASHAAISKSLGAWTKEPQFYRNIIFFGRGSIQYKQTWGRCGEECKRQIKAIRDKSEDEDLNKWLDEVVKEIPYLLPLPKN
jgi:hypothetical protein